MDLRWQKAKNILCVRLDNMGDVLMTTPAIRALRQKRPGAAVTLLCRAGVQDICRLIPEIDRTIAYDAPWVKATADRSSQPDLEMIERLKEERFDAAVIFTVYSQNPLPAALLCYLADIPLRLAHCRENPYQLLTDWIEDEEPHEFIRHEVRRQLELVESIGCVTACERLSLQIPQSAASRVTAMLNRTQLSGERLVVLHPGATAQSRRYPPERFAEVVNTLARYDECQVVLTGSLEEVDVIRTIQEQAHVGIPSFVGMFDVAELSALIDMASVLITNNTGPAHIAAAVGTPVVDLYALTNPQHTPWQVASRVLFYDVPCKFCYKSICPEGHHDCLRKVSVDAVVQAVRDLLPVKGQGDDIQSPVTSSIMNVLV